MSVATITYAPPPTKIKDVILGLGPASFWTFDAVTGDFADQGSGGITGTAGTGIFTRAMKGLRGNRCAYSDNGDTNRGNPIASMGDVYRFANRSAFTVAVIFYPTNFGTNFRRLVAKESNWGILGVNNTGRPAIARAGGGTVTCDFGVTLNEWHLAAGLYDGSNGGIYCNGVLKSAADATDVGAGTTQAFRVNGEPGNAVDWGVPGRYQSVAVWTRALTQAELDLIWGVF
jgi:hypothetical protein